MLREFVNPTVVRLGVAIFGAAALAAALLLPEPGEERARRTADLAVLGYGFAAALMVQLRRDDWQAMTTLGRLARDIWTLAYLTFVVHIAVAFGDYHGWSHTAAVRHVQEVSGFGPGIYISHLFTLVWMMDVLVWWCVPQTYAGRPAWLGRYLHGFMAFMMVNATVVYETGPVRWGGLALALTLVALWMRRLRG